MYIMLNYGYVGRGQHVRKGFRPPENARLARHPCRGLRNRESRQRGYDDPRPGPCAWQWRELAFAFMQAMRCPLADLQAAADDGQDPATLTIINERVATSMRQSHYER